MKILYAIFLSMVGQSTAWAQSISVTGLDGGSVVTKLGYGIEVNKGSKLHRTWVVLNDPGGPLQLADAGLNTGYEDRDYKYEPAGTAKPLEDITAIEVRFLLYDVFGDHIKTLAGTTIRDFPANQPIELKTIGTWHGWESEVSELYTVVAFVANVRTSSGKIWRHNAKVVSEELNKIRLQVTSGVLDPTKQKEK